MPKTVGGMDRSARWSLACTMVVWPRLARRGENRDTLTRLARLPFQGFCEKGRGMHESRVPNWGKWLNVPSVKVWQAVALSLNIEPGKVQHSSESWMAGRMVFAEGQEFADRLDVTTANLMCNGKLKPMPIVMGEPGSCLVSLADFVSFAESVKWPVPPELKQLSATSSMIIWEGFDPDSATYPPELDIAFQAWRAATTRPSKGKTAKEQLKDWLATNYPKLSGDAIDRIAIVCNWEKQAGRRKMN
jgi:hypothetical protein